jgi:hypothetical protein
MADYASAARNRVGGVFYDPTGKIIALDPRPRMTLELSEQFNTGTGVYVAKASTGVNTGDVPVTNGSVHIYRPNMVRVNAGNVELSAVKEGTQWYSAYLDTEGTYQVSSQFAIYTKFRLPYGFGPGAWPNGSTPTRTGSTSRRTTTIPTAPATPATPPSLTTRSA